MTFTGNWWINPLKKLCGIKDSKSGANNLRNVEWLKWEAKKAKSYNQSFVTTMPPLLLSWWLKGWLQTGHFASEVPYVTWFNDLWFSYLEYFHNVKM